MIFAKNVGTCSFLADEILNNHPFKSQFVYIRISIEANFSHHTLNVFKSHRPSSSLKSFQNCVLVDQPGFENVKVSEELADICGRELFFGECGC